MSWLANSPGGALKLRNILSQILLWKKQNIVFHHFRRRAAFYPGEVIRPPLSSEQGTHVRDGRWMLKRFSDVHCLARTWSGPSFEHYQSDISLLDGRQQNMRLGYPVRTTLLASLMRFDFIRARVRAQTPTDWLWHLIFTAVVLDFVNLAWLALRSLR